MRLVQSRCCTLVLLGFTLGFLSVAAGCPRPPRLQDSDSAAGESSEVERTAQGSSSDSASSAEGEAGEHQASPDSPQSGSQGGSPGGSNEEPGSGGPPAGSRGEKSGGGGDGFPPPSDSDAGGTSGPAGHGAGGAGPGTADGKPLPGRNAAMQEAREALARSGDGGDPEGQYQDLLRAWQGLQPFAARDPEAAGVAAKLLQQMERYGTVLDRRQPHPTDKPLIAR